LRSTRQLQIFELRYNRVWWTGNPQRHYDLPNFDHRGSTFNYILSLDNTCATPATVRLFLERKNDDLSEEFYRWWAHTISYELQATPGNITLTVPLTPDQWSSVYGRTGNYDAAALAGFQDALQNLGNVGMTFGGGCFFGHGVNVSGGSARFALINYTIS